MQTKQITIAAAAILLATLPGMAQPFSSGSTGADGALNIATGAGTVIFDPVALGIDADGDNVFHFTTITIAQGTTLQLRANKMRNPAVGVVFLATGDVRVAGTIDAKATDPVAMNPSTNEAGYLANRLSSIPGPGGYPGGAGSRAGVAPQSGAGPGGGPGGLLSAVALQCIGGLPSHQLTGSPATANRNPVTYGNFNLIPMYGGSGGGGGWGNTADKVGGTGGAGGGAIRIVSTTRIDVVGPFGVIDARGGNLSNSSITGDIAGCQGGPGSGGSIHLIAPVIPSIQGLSAIGGSNPNQGTNAGTGYIRINTGSDPAGNSSPAAIVGPLFNPPLPALTPIPSLRIVSVNNVAAPSRPSLNFLSPDIQINANTPVNVAISASNVPVGTIVMLRLSSEVGGDQTLACDPLAGTVTASTATCTATFPFLVSVANVRATW